jgi:tRNA pseudouridine55 synthase
VSGALLRDGLLLIDKEAGGTSHDVVQRVRRILGEKRVGHCGTLDPDATGLLLVTVGIATRLTRFLISAPKVYEGTIRFGVATDTYDAAGRVTAEAPAAGLTHDAVAAAMAGFVGEIDHASPAYSAKKHQGRKLYELARRGEEVPVETKRVTVYEFTPVGEISFSPGAGLRPDSPGAGLRPDDARIDFRLACSSGTYARTLAHEVGRAVGTGAHLARLRRLRIGTFDVENSVSLDALAAAVEAGEAPGSAWIPFDDVPLPFAEVTADAQQERRVLHGQTVLVRDLGGEEGDWVRLVDRRHKTLAVGTVAERIGERGVGIVQPRIVFGGR